MRNRIQEGGGKSTTLSTYYARLVFTRNIFKHFYMEGEEGSMLRITFVTSSFGLSILDVHVVASYAFSYLSTYLWTYITLYLSVYLFT